MQDNDCERCGKDAGPDGLNHYEPHGLAYCASCEAEADAEETQAPLIEVFQTHEARARHKVWSAVQTDEGVTLSASEARALWRSILDDSQARIRAEIRVEELNRA